MEQLTGDADEFAILDPRTRATLEDVAFVLVGEKAVVVARDGETSYGIPNITRVAITNPELVEATNDGTVVYKFSGAVTIVEDGDDWVLYSKVSVN